jgi:predicted permease
MRAMDTHLIYNVLKAAAPLFCLVGIGYLAKKRRILIESDVEIHNRFVLNNALPALMRF